MEGLERWGIEGVPHALRLVDNKKQHQKLFFIYYSFLGVLAVGEAPLVSIVLM
jgi:hypothetical protein